jgi:hypothetical protein
MPLGASVLPAQRNPAAAQSTAGSIVLGWFANGASVTFVRAAPLRFAIAVGAAASSRPDFAWMPRSQ